MLEKQEIDQKLDGGLRRLLRMKEADILNIMKIREAAITQQLDNLKSRLQDVLPPAASKDDQSGGAPRSGVVTSNHYTSPPTWIPDH